MCLLSELICFARVVEKLKTTFGASRFKKYAMRSRSQPVGFANLPPHREEKVRLATDVICQQGTKEDPVKALFLAPCAVVADVERKCLLWRDKLESALSMPLRMVIGDPPFDVPEPARRRRSPRSVPDTGAEEEDERFFSFPRRHQATGAARASSLSSPSSAVAEPPFEVAAGPRC